MNTEFKIIEKVLRRINSLRYDKIHVAYGNIHIGNGCILRVWINENGAVENRINLMKETFSQGLSLSKASLKYLLYVLSERRRYFHGLQDYLPRLNVQITEAEEQGYIKWKAEQTKVAA